MIKDTFKRIPIIFKIIIVAAFVIRIATNWQTPFHYELEAISALNMSIGSFISNIDLYTGFTFLKILNLGVVVLLFLSMYRNLKIYCEDDGVSSFISLTIIALNPFLIFINRNLTLNNLGILLISLAAHNIAVNRDRKNFSGMILSGLFLALASLTNNDIIFISIGLIIISAISRKETTHIIAGVYFLLIAVFNLSGLLNFNNLIISESPIRLAVQIKLLAEYLLIPIILFALIGQYRFQLRLIKNELTSSIIVAVMALLPLFLGFSYERLYFACAIIFSSLVYFSGGLLKYFYVQNKQYIYAILFFIVFMTAFSAYRVMLIETKYANTKAIREYVHEKFKSHNRILTDNPSLIKAVYPRIIYNGKLDVLAKKDAKFDTKVMENLSNYRYHYVVLSKRTSESDLEKLSDNYLSKYYKLSFRDKNNQDDKTNQEYNYLIFDNSFIY